MKTFFEEKRISIMNGDGDVLEFFMRPIKIKELPVINRVSLLAEESDAEEFTTPLLLSLMINCLSIDGEKVPASATQDLMQTFIEYNFPIPDEEEEKAKAHKKKKESEPLSFYIDFLVSIGYSLADIMEMTMMQFNELIIKAGERLNPKSKVMDPLEAFRKMGIPIRGGAK
jgi:hypothetical protein